MIKKDKVFIGIYGVLISFVFYSSFLFAELPEPYNSLEVVLPFDPQSMFSDECRQNLTRIIHEYNVKTVIEIGCWLGASTRAIATLLPPDGKVYAVDHWKGSEEHQIVHAHKLPTLYEQFLSNIIHAGLTHKIVPIRKSSLEAVKECEITPDLIYIDAAHDEKSVYEDLVAWWPFVKGNGILCGDDYQREGDPVGKAVRRFAKENNLRVEGYKWFWVLWEK